MRGVILTVCALAQVSAVTYAVVYDDPWFAVANLCVGFCVALAWALAPEAGR